MRFTTHTIVLKTLRTLIPELTRSQLKNSRTCCSGALPFYHWINFRLVLLFKLYQLYKFDIILDKILYFFKRKYICAVSFWTVEDCFVLRYVSLYIIFKAELMELVVAWG